MKAAFLQQFQAKHGRRPRILHIGNIANNAYLNAKFLNDAGFDCDVLCYDYYHIMGCPEWEDASFDASQLNHFTPSWSTLDLNGFSRPRWFAQGPIESCIDYLIAKRTDKLAMATQLWHQLCRINQTEKTSGATKFPLARIKQLARALVFRSDALSATWAKLGSIAARKGTLGYLAVGCLAAPLLIPAVVGIRMTRRLLGLGSKEERRFADVVAKRVQEFAEAFPHRSDHLSPEDCADYAAQVAKLKELFAHYDLVHGYATDGVWPLLADFPYVAFEHGTIRNIPFEATRQGRLCAATYRFAHQVIITNADNYIAANKLGLKAYSFVPHPVNDSTSEAGEHSYEALHQEMAADFIIFHPSRQHWDDTRHPDWEKGNDLLIKAFAKFVTSTNRRAAAVFVDWGKSVNSSKRLLEILGVADRVKWIAPIPHQRMINLIRATDLVADQFYLGAFGSTMPKALACAKPAMLYLNEQIHEWCFPELPPVVNVKTEEEILDGLEKLYRDKEYYKKLCDVGFDWYERWHSREVVVDKLTTVYAKALA